MNKFPLSPSRRSTLAWIVLDRTYQGDGEPYIKIADVQYEINDDNLWQHWDFDKNEKVLTPPEIVMKLDENLYEQAINCRDTMNQALGDNDHKLRPKDWNLRERIIQALLPVEGWLSTHEILNKFPDELKDIDQQRKSFLELLKFMAKEGELNAMLIDDGVENPKGKLGRSMFRLTYRERERRQQ